MTSLDPFIGGASGKGHFVLVEQGQAVGFEEYLREVRCPYTRRPRAGYGDHSWPAKIPRGFRVFYFAEGVLRSEVIEYLAFFFDGFDPAEVLVPCRGSR